MTELSQYIKTLPNHEFIIGLKVFHKNNEEYLYIKDTEGGIFAGKNKADDFGRYYSISSLKIDVK